MNASLLFASSSFGRIILHAACLLREPRHLGWHLRGILRELSGPHNWVLQHKPHRGHFALALATFALTLGLRPGAAQPSPSQMAGWNADGNLKDALAKSSDGTIQSRASFTPGAVTEGNSW
jgi:hypothetical protein